MTSPTWTRSGPCASWSRRASSTRRIRVGVRSDEGPQEIADEADVVVDGTEGVRELLAVLVAD